MNDAYFRGKTFYASRLVSARLNFYATRRKGKGVAYARLVSARLNFYATRRALNAKFNYLYTL